MKYLDFAFWSSWRIRFGVLRARGWQNVLDKSGVTRGRFARASPRAFGGSGNWVWCIVIWTNYRVQLVPVELVFIVGDYLHGDARGSRGRRPRSSSKRA